MQGSLKSCPLRMTAKDLCDLERNQCRQLISKRSIFCSIKKEFLILWVNILHLFIFLDIEH